MVILTLHVHVFEAMKIPDMKSPQTYKALRSCHVETRRICINELGSARRESVPIDRKYDVF